MELLRQGDVLLRKVESHKIENWIKKEDKCVAYGEHSGHAHVATGDCDVFEIEGNMYVVVGNDGGKLEHLHLPTKSKADHDLLTLSEGVYEVILQNQYNPYSRLMERVID